MNMMHYISVFQKITKVDLKDCFEDEVSKQLVYIVGNGLISRAIGKGGANARMLERVLKRKIRIVQYSDEVCGFVENLLSPLKAAGVEKSEEGIIVIEPLDRATRGLIIGRGGINLRNLEKNVKRYFEIKEIKVV